MFYLVRKSVLGSNDEFQDLDFDLDILTLGSNDNCSVVLDEMFDAEISIKAINNSEAKFNGINDTVLIDNGKELSTGLLRLNQTYQLGVYDIEVIDPPSGFDFAINILRSKRKAVGQKKKFQIQKSKNKFSLRSISYLLFFLILSLFLIIPYLSSQNEELSHSVKKLPIPTDVSWSSGPMAMAHRIPEIGQDCKVCHVKPFEKVQDKQCLDCHHNLGDHVSQVHPAVDEFSQFLCQNCHKEHNEPAQITRTDDALCIDCHKDIENFSPIENNKVQSVVGFNKTDHPNFRLSLIDPVVIDGNYEWIKSRSPFDANKPPVEQSNLKFSHNVHLDKEMVQNESTGEALSCNSCHQLKSDEEHFEPITMDKDCRSCHKLTFDVFNPDIELPHGNLRAATVMLQAHFIREFTDPELRNIRSAKKVRRIPDRNNNDASCQGSGLNCGRKEALKEAEFQFSNNGCVTCHEVTENGNSDILSRWFVKPIKINNDWYTKASFNHLSHLSVKGQNEQQTCLSCHNVKSSDKSTDVAMPQNEICMACHEQGEVQSVELSCTRCHQFHFIKPE